MTAAHEAPDAAGIPQADANEARFRKLLERIARWTEAEVACASPAQVRHVAQLVLDGADPTYPPSADPTRKHEDAEVTRLREHIIHVQTRIEDGRELGETVWRLTLEDIVRENRAALAGAPQIMADADATTKRNPLTGQPYLSMRDAFDAESG
ncbi:hypothetical protein LK533_05980 [Sphingomonas sp. PL-96]|uniref:hypothetical protein n=1 Tax=Sphingomonas sp. PL-96 TaxID=2887201 RepID=UPI001E5BE684|nr:hypothetical protein [Sphingomonas sp. PL-96]MCC2976221.1 hypothetical protein [Sphingomonas sp. PL-96]